ncbi:unnamed protein product, partial [Linum tenue]
NSPTTFFGLKTRQLSRKRPPLSPSLFFLYGRTKQKERTTCPLLLACFPEENDSPPLCKHTAPLSLSLVNPSTSSKTKEKTRGASPFPFTADLLSSRSAAGDSNLGEEEKGKEGSAGDEGKSTTGERKEEIWVPRFCRRQRFG